MDLFLRFQKFIADHALFNKGDGLLVAVSGGADSVVLCDLCYKAGYKFSIAHCNFKLRNEESEGDAQFVKDLAEKYKVACYVKEFNTAAYVNDNKVSIQVAARELRYGWFKDLMNDKVTAQSYLLTAHHADDNIETVLMNFFKGTGIAGLKGILPRQKQIIRPLLFASKEDIHKYISEHKLPYREDSSNADDKYTRNYFRNELIPGLEKVFPKAKANVLHNAERFRDINAIYDDAVKKTIVKLVAKSGNEIHIPVLKLLKTRGYRTILFEIIKDLGFSTAQLPDIISLTDSGNGKYVSGKTHRVIRDRKWLIIAPINTSESDHIVIESSDKGITFPGGQLTFKKVGVVGEADRYTAYIDAEKISYPLILKKWGTGDYFYPLGLIKQSGKPGKKKISRFLVDQKIPLHKKESIWVIESDHRIVWVVGMRMDERFKVTEATTSILEIKLITE